MGRPPIGVGCSCVPTQELRFVQLMKLCNLPEFFSLKDLGCGYGALLAYLAKRHSEAKIDYLGIDLSPAMVRRAKRLWRNQKDAKFVVGHAGPRIADYSLASGIFNVKLEQPLAQWEHFVALTLADMAATSRQGFAVNFLAPLSGGGRLSTLYRAPAEPWIHFCEQELGCSVELLTNYGLQEYTLLFANSFGSVASTFS
jgi:SAM-dependent methyltransferase